MGDMNHHPAASVDGLFIIHRLEEAGATLLSLPGTGYTPRLRVASLDVVYCAAEAFGWDKTRIRPPVPPASKISRMDEALGWITLIPRERFVLRRIVGARALVSPLTERHLYSWRRLGEVVGADTADVKRWHGQGIDILTGAVNALRTVRAA